MVEGGQKIRARTPPPSFRAMPERNHFFSVRCSLRIHIFLSGVRSLGLSSNEYLVWLVHLPASDKDQVETLSMSFIKCNSV